MIIEKNIKFLKYIKIEDSREIPQILVKRERETWDLEGLLNVVVWLKSKDGNLNVCNLSPLHKNNVYINTTYKRDSFTKTHKNSFLEITYVEKGVLKKRVNDECRNFKAGEIGIINGKNNHCEYMDESDGVYCFLMISEEYFEKNVFAEYSDLASEKFIKEIIHKNMHMYKVLHFKPKTSRTEVNCLFESIVEELIKRKPGFLSVVIGYVERILNLLTSEYKISLVKDERLKYNEILFFDIKRYIEEHYAYVTEKAIAEIFYYTPKYINIIIKKYTGLSYSNYLKVVRLKKARELLENTDYSVEEIAASVGYTNLSFFYKNFRSYFGTTPKGVRNNLK